MSISLHSAADPGKMSGFPGAWIGGIVFALVAAVVLGDLGYILYGSKYQASSDLLLPFLSLLVAALFALAPLFACFAHTISIGRQIDKLNSLVLTKIKDTKYFIIAKGNLASIRCLCATA
jgi:hypothetical protein